jgi:DNA polymerase-3 subunit epsilon
MSGVPAGVSVEKTYEVVLKMLLLLMAAKLLIVVIQSILTEMMVSFVFAMLMGKAFPSADTTRLWDSVRKNEEWCKQLLRILRDGSRKPPASPLNPMKCLKNSEENKFTPSGFVMIEGEVIRCESPNDSELPTYDEFMKGKEKYDKFFSNLVDAFRFVTKKEEVVREKFVALPKLEGRVVYYVFDIETTGMSKTADRIIELSAIAVNGRGDVYGKEFSKRIGTTVPINPRAQAVHGISAEDLETELDFSVVGVEFLTWMESFLGGDGDVGVLVAHNGDSCDFQFLCAEMWRWGLAMPKEVRYTLDTLSVIREYKDIPYCPNAVEKLSGEEWPERTATGLPRLTCSAIVNVLLKEPKRIALRGRKIHLGLGEGTFETVCGVAHSALADAVGCAVVMFDKKGMEPKLAKGRVYGEVRSHWDKVVGKIGS